MYIKKTQQFYYFQNKAKHYDTIKNIKPAIDNKLQKQYLKILHFNGTSKNISNDKSNQSLNKYGNNMSNNSYMGSSINVNNNNNSINSNISNINNNIPTTTNINKPKPLIPFMRQHQMRLQNQNLINRLVKMYKSPRTQVSAQGNYSRYNNPTRTFRQSNPYQSQINRTIQLDNSQLSNRIKKIKPRIGNTIQWNQHFGRTMNLKKNMSRYCLEQDQNQNQNNNTSNDKVIKIRQKGGLHISVERFIPQYYNAYVDKTMLDQRRNNSQLSQPKQIQITHQGILTLPNIKNNRKNNHNQQSHTITYTKNKMIIDRSRTSLTKIHKKQQSSLINPQLQSEIIQNYNIKNHLKKRQKRKLLEFKFQTQVSQKNKRNSKINNKLNNKKIVKVIEQQMS